jgi:group I intron endonuclease
MKTSQTIKKLYLKHGYGDIYVLQSPSGKCYVGQAIHFLTKGKQWGTEERWVSHIHDSNRKNGGTCRKLNYAIRKYGPGNFNVNTLLVCRLEYLDYFEQMFIAEYNSNGEGYNLRKGGNKSELSTETRNLMSIAQTGDRNHNYGKSPKDETKKKISVTLINNVERYDHLERRLPKYIKFIDWEDRKGYAIVSHPECKIKYFVSCKIDIALLFQKCLTHLRTLGT